MQCYTAGLKPAELNDLEFRQVILFLRGHERRTQEQWEMARLQCWFTYRMQTTEKVAKTVQQLLPMPWDKKRDRGPALDAETVKRMIQLHSGKKV